MNFQNFGVFGLWNFGYRILNCSDVEINSASTEKHTQKHRSRGLSLRKKCNDISGNTGNKIRQEMEIIGRNFLSKVGENDVLPQNLNLSHRNSPKLSCFILNGFRQVDVERL